MNNEALSRHIATVLMPPSVDPGLHQKTYMLTLDAITSFNKDLEPDVE